MGSIVYTNQRSTKSRKQLAKQRSLAKQTQSARKKMKKMMKGTLSVKDTMFRREGTKSIPSLESDVCDTSLKEVPHYTGDKLIGIAIMHKSCLQPIFSKQQAEDSAHMRR